MMSCRLCGAARSAALLRWQSLQLLRCRSCRFVFLERDPSRTNQEKFDQVYAEKATLNELTTERYAELLRWLSAARRTNRLLEIGCGAGWFLAQARADSWDAVGTETSSIAIDRLRADGLDVRHGEAWCGQFADGTFDAVVLLEVIEHVGDFHRVLEEARRVLRPQGRLVLSTPNIDSLTRRLIGGRWRIVTEEHLWYFSPRTLTQLLRAHGFEILLLQTRNIYPPDLWLAFHSPTTAPVQRAYGCQTDSRLRAFTTRSPLGRMMKAAANGVLRWTGTGDTIWLFGQRGPGAPRAVGSESKTEEMVSSCAAS